MSATWSDKDCEKFEKTLIVEKLDTGEKHIAKQFTMTESGEACASRIRGFVDDYGKDMLPGYPDNWDVVIVSNVTVHFQLKEKP